MSVNWYRTCAFGLDHDLRPLLQYLQREGVAAHVTEEAGQQVLWLSVETDEAQLRQWFDAAWSEAATQVPQSPSAKAVIHPAIRGAHLLIGQPVTLLLIILSLIGTLPVAFDASFHWLSHFTFTGFRLQGAQIYFSDLQTTLAHGDYWRLFTPMFIHFGLLHVLFNSLWMWELGRRVERMQSPGRLLLLVLFTSLAANGLQYAMSGPSLFGGMSGVVYGLVGYIWTWQRFEGPASLRVSPTLIGFMMFFLVLGFTGAMDFFIDGSVANGAHLGGLLGGILFAAALLLFQKFARKRQGNEL